MLDYAALVFSEREGGREGGKEGGRERAQGGRERGRRGGLERERGREEGGGIETLSMLANLSDSVTSS